MKSDIEKMRERHKQEIKELQDNCTHAVWTEWTEWHYDILHKADTLRRWCIRCSKLMDETDPPDYS